MLVLGRKENESIIIGDAIKITIVGRSGSSIRLGIQAPRDIRVMRAELTPNCHEPGFSEPGFSEPGFSEPGLSELGLSELGLSELGFSELSSPVHDLE